MKKLLCTLVGNLCAETNSKEFHECYGTVENFAEIAKERGGDFLLGYLAEIKRDTLYLIRCGGDSDIRRLYNMARRLERLVKREETRK